MFDPKQLLSGGNGNSLVSKMLGSMATKEFAGGLLAGGIGSQLVGKDTLEGAAKIGGLALLGTLAYKSYNAYQKNKAAGEPASITGAVKQGAQDMVTQGKSLATNFKSLIANAKQSTQVPALIIPAPTSELSLAVIRAMIGAAKADGKVDADESSRILGHLESQGLNAEEKMFLMQEMANPQDANVIALAAKSPEEAAEIYLAALLVCGSQCKAEQDYLAQLAMALKLEPAFAEALQRELARAQTAQAA
jgi:uncharacterized membrane protein YebE (DUF533 family)